MTTNRVSNDQLDELLEFLTEHPALAKGVGLGARSKETVDKQWNELASKLNSHGFGSSKTGERWKKYWADIKHKCKARVAKRRRDALGTGGGPSSQNDLSEVDKKVLAIIGEQAVFGDVEHRIPLLDINLQTETQMQNDNVMVSQEVLIAGDIVENMPITLTPSSPSTRGQTSRIYTSEMPVTQATSSSVTDLETHREPELARTEVRSPISRPSVERPGVKRKRIVSPPSQSRVQPEWVMELEANRVEAEKKLANAALIMAEASRMQAEAANVQVEAARMQTETIRKLVDLLRKQSEDIHVLFTSNMKSNRQI